MDLQIARISVAGIYALLGIFVLVAGRRAAANRALATYVVGTWLHVVFGMLVGPLGVPVALEHIALAVIYLDLAAAVVMLMAAFVYAFWILAPTMLLAYVVLRGQIEGLDVKVRFAISKSTIAAAFVAAFFVASEGAQILLGRGNEWVGLFAAGALVFAIAPLQRVAEKAVPLAGGDGDAGPVGATALSGTDARQRNIYVFAVCAALCGGSVTRATEERLAHAAVGLGISHPGAVRVLRTIEEERDVA